MERRVSNLMGERMRSWGRTGGSAALSAGLAIVAIMTITALPAQAQVYKTLYSFTGGSTGSTPEAGVIQDASGNLYSTTVFGGSGMGYGVVFKLDPLSEFTVLYSFTGGSDGSFPAGAIAQDAEGNLYGTTSSGGDSGNGVVFKVDSMGNETVLHSFTGGTADGVDPNGVIRDPAGNLYGTTFGGGDSGNGVVFKVDAAGVETLLYSFKGLGDGGTPYGGLILDAAGNLYGTTGFGGLFGGNRCGNGCGVVFKLDSAGNETVLFPFDGNSGKEPHGSLVRDAAGNLYGTTLRGGNTDLGTCLFAGCGVVFKVAPGGRETVLHSFTGGADGGNSYAGLVRDWAGNLYGTTSRGGSGYGVVFKLDGNGQETVLHSFRRTFDGADPMAPLLTGAGTLYGTTAEGGLAGDAGAVFEISVK